MGRGGARSWLRRPPLGRRPIPSKSLIARNRGRGVEPDWRSGIPAHRRDRDVPWEIEMRALDALDEVLGHDADWGADGVEADAKIGVG
jgi:hypothetical protein